MLTAIAAGATILGTGYSIAANKKNAAATRAAAEANAIEIERVGKINAELAANAAQYNAIVIERNAKLAALTAGYNATLADTDAWIAEQDAQSARSTAAYNADRIRAHVARLSGTQRAAFAKSGVTLDGSAADVMYDTAMQGELEALVEKHAGALESRKLRLAGMSHKHRANMLRWQSRTLLTMGKHEANEVRKKGRLDSFLAIDQSKGQARVTRAGGQASSDAMLAQNPALLISGITQTADILSRSD